jgi:hypothetical protein
MWMKSSVASIAIAGIVALGSAASAEDPPTREQVEKLQQQLAEMQKEMDALKQALPPGGSAGPHGMMHRHMEGMQRHWQTMHDQTCEMAPGTCPHMGAAPAPQ